MKKALLISALGILLVWILFYGITSSCGRGIEQEILQRDTTPPTIASTTPTSGATGVAINSTVRATFSESMESSSINPSAFVLSSSQGQVSGETSYDTTNIAAVFDPKSDLSANTTYVATVTAGVKDFAGNNMNSDHSWSFTTGTQSDGIAPTVYALSPASGTTEVALNTAIRVIFSEEMDSSTITASTFTLTYSEGPVSGLVSYDDASRTATFTPSSNLDYGVSYTATITTSVKDLAGNNLAAVYPWSFTTKQLWAAQNSNTSSNFHGIFFADANTGIVTGWDGVILKTTDGGNTWNPKTSGTTQHLWDASFANTSTGWVVGLGGVVLRTTDTGETWTSQESGTTNALHGISFPVTGVGWVVGETGVIRKTMNGGFSWDTQNPNTSQKLWDVYFVAGHTGWAVGENGTIVATTNSGTNWNAQTSGTNKHLYGAHFISTTEGWAVGQSGTILKTSNGGNTWSSQESGTSQDLVGVYFLDADTGWAVGDYTTILATTNGGSTWSLQKSAAGNLNNVFFINSTTGWAVGGVGVIYKYSP